MTLMDIFQDLESRSNFIDLESRIEHAKNHLSVRASRDQLLWLLEMVLYKSGRFDDKKFPLSPDQMDRLDGTVS